jgi:hypothetical protein
MMIRESRYVAGHRPYAVKLDGLAIEERPDPKLAYLTLPAVWFRRRKGLLVACVGYLWDYQLATVTTPEFLRGLGTALYGGTCQGRWDGERYWGQQEPDLIEHHLNLLRPMLDSFPDVPEGYDGWWTSHV